MNKHLVCEQRQQKVHMFCVNFFLVHEPIHRSSPFGLPQLCGPLLVAENPVRVGVHRGGVRTVRLELARDVRQQLPARRAKARKKTIQGRQQ